MRIEYQLNLADLSAGLAAHRPSRLLSRFLGVSACISLIGIGLLLPQIPGASPAVLADVRKWSWMSLSLGVAFLLALVVQEWTLQRILRRRATASEHTVVSIEERGIVAESRAAKSQLEWGRFSDFRESEGHFLLYHSRDQYFVFPKRAFAAQNDIVTFRGLLQRNIQRVGGARGPTTG